MHITYRELLEKLKVIPDERLDDIATVSLDLSEEAMPVTDLVEVLRGDILDGVLDIGHWVLTIDF